ncbi:MAG: polysaccharide deacetylase family protein [Pirellulaceae bacterium]
MREPAYWLYQKLTRRYRTELLSQLRSERKMPIAILFYHRVADSFPNGWTLSCRDFCRHLDWLQANYEIVSLAEAQARIRSETCDQPTAAITFDDGYADNAEFAIPELSRRGLTATYFVATEFIRTDSPFPHDKTAGVPLKPNTIDELRSFVEQGIEIGAHTRNHVDVGQVHGAQLREEIGGSVRELQQWLNVPIRYFAAPFGLPENLSQAAVDICHELGLDGFCSAYGAFNWPNHCGFHLRRIHADPGLERLKNWLTLDARKLDDQTQLPFKEPAYSQN